MNRLSIIASLILTAVMFASGYVVIFVTSMMAMAFDLPGPYTKEPIAWVWLSLHVIMLFGGSFLFCRWLIKRAEGIDANKRTFE